MPASFTTMPFPLIENRLRKSQLILSQDVHSCCRKGFGGGNCNFLQCMSLGRIQKTSQKLSSMGNDFVLHRRKALCFVFIQINMLMPMFDVSITICVQGTMVCLFQTNAPRTDLSIPLYVVGCVHDSYFGCVPLKI